MFSVMCTPQLTPLSSPNRLKSGYPFSYSSFTLQRSDPHSHTFLHDLPISLFFILLPLKHTWISTSSSLLFSHYHPPIFHSIPWPLVTWIIIHTICSGIFQFSVLSVTCLGIFALHSFTQPPIPHSSLSIPVPCTHTHFLLRVYVKSPSPTPRFLLPLISVSSHPLV